MYFTAGVRLGWLSTILVFSIIVMPLGPGAAEPQQTAPSPTVAERATLVVLNDSGKVLFSSRQKVEDNGEIIVSLARHEYQRVSMAPGRHVLRLPHRRNPQVVLEAEAGRTYYLLVAYKPEKSYFAPFLGSPFVLAEIPEDIARTLMAEMTEKAEAGGTSTRAAAPPPAAAAPAATDPPPAAQPVGGSGAVASLHAPRSSRQTPGVTVTLEERDRKPGRKGTRVTYAIRTSGFPEGRTFQVLSSSLATKRERSVVATGVRADASGVLAGGSVPIETLSIVIEDYNKGEPITIEVVADDKSVYARDTVFPFPLVARHGACQVWAELVNRDRKSFAVIGEGFRPGERVQIRSTDGYDPKEWSVAADESGSVFAGIDHGRSGGTALFTAAGEGCSVTLTYEFGKKAKGPM